MRLSAKLIVNYAGPNQFDYEEQWKVRAGDSNTLYFQLCDLDQRKLRYLAGLGSSNQPYSMTVTFPSVDDTKKIVAIALQVSTVDSSIWSVQLFGSQQPYSGNVIFTLYQGNNINTFSLMNALSVEYPLADGNC